METGGMPDMGGPAGTPGAPAAAAGTPGTSGETEDAPDAAPVGPAGPVAAAGWAGCFLGRPRPGPGLRVIGFSVGSTFLGLSPGTPLASALFWARRNPWKCWLIWESARKSRGGGGALGIRIELRWVGSNSAHQCKGQREGGYASFNKVNNPARLEHTQCTKPRRASNR